ncbi:MAG: hypothetical protein EP332_02795 [Bacteroidetes bacterium]|nr:MAG: hypothetical protein EP332_02795 [Bacteroidota bacterium]
MKKLIQYTMLACTLFIVVDLTSCTQERIAISTFNEVELQSEVLNSLEWQEALNQNGTIVVNTTKSQGLQHAEQRRVLVLSLENQ